MSKEYVLCLMHEGIEMHRCRKLSYALNNLHLQVEVLSSQRQTEHLGCSGDLKHLAT